jgi:hypothetical protein
MYLRLSVLLYGHNNLSFTLQKEYTYIPQLSVASKEIFSVNNLQLLKGLTGCLSQNRYFHLWLCALLKEILSREGVSVCGLFFFLREQTENLHNY